MPYLPSPPLSLHPSSPADSSVLSRNPQRLVNSSVVSKKSSKPFARVRRDSSSSLPTSPHWTSSLTSPSSLKNPTASSTAGYQVKRNSVSPREPREPPRVFSFVLLQGGARLPRTERWLKRRPQPRRSRNGRSRCWSAWRKSRLW